MKKIKIGNIEIGPDEFNPKNGLWHVPFFWVLSITRTNHSTEHQANGLEIAERYIAPGGYILVDDTNSPENTALTLHFQAKHAGKYALVLNKGTPNNGHPTFWNGFMILKKTLFLSKAKIIALTQNLASGEGE